MKVWHNAYNRTLGANLGIAMKRMAASNALIVGMNGLGVEIGLW